MTNNIHAALNLISEATGGDLYDAEWDGGTWMHDAVQTAETLENFEDAAKNYAERGTIERGELAGFKFIHFGVVQTHKGAQRRSLSVIDLGDVRFAIDADLTDYA
jgi:hypothetical protein